MLVKIQCQMVTSKQFISKKTGKKFYRCGFKTLDQDLFESFLAVENLTDDDLILLETMDEKTFSIPSDVMPSLLYRPI